MFHHLSFEDFIRLWLGRKSSGIKAYHMFLNYGNYILYPYSIDEAHSTYF